MSLSLSYLRRGLLGIALTGSLGFGTTQALAAPQETVYPSCNPFDWNEHIACDWWCMQEFNGIGGECDFQTRRCSCFNQ